VSGLKELRIRINSVKSTQKITKAMKLVAASKLRRARENAEAARPYSEHMESMLKRLRSGVEASGNAPELLVGNGKDDRHLVIVATSDRGLCGGFNTTIIKAAKNHIQSLLSQGKQVRLICAGRKGYDVLRREHKSLIEDYIDGSEQPLADYKTAKAIATTALEQFDEGKVDVVSLFYSEFVSVISQQVRHQQLIPLPAAESNDNAPANDAVYDYEPDEEQILAQLLPRNVETQVFRALLENTASEQGARMTAMDNATRNAGDMIDRLTLQYNRSRQAAITTELTEIISGAEAL